MRRRPPRSTQSRSSAASDVYKRQRPLPDTVKIQKTPGVIPEVCRGDLSGKGEDGFPITHGGHDCDGDGFPIFWNPDPFDSAQDKVHEGSRTVVASSTWAQILRCAQDDNSIG